MKHKLTLKKVNDHIQSKYPQVELVRGVHYFYIAGIGDEWGLKIAGLYQSSITVDKINDLTLGGWMDAVEFVLRDNHNGRYSRTPLIPDEITDKDIVESIID